MSAEYESASKEAAVTSLATGDPVLDRWLAWGVGRPEPQFAIPMAVIRDRIVDGIREGRFTADQVHAQIGELVALWAEVRAVVGE